ncbi:hypothetical protein [Kocuria marina]|uniref:hypothetical protein n=1 Tax=Kocuria marina TaxID=223184 RepID=UPI003460819F
MTKNAYLSISIVLAIVAIASIWWVLEAPTVIDDQGTRATFAGWIISIISAIGAVFSAIKGKQSSINVQHTKKEAAPQGSGTVNAKNIKQNNKRNGTGFIGGTHTHHHK